LVQSLRKYLIIPIIFIISFSSCSDDFKDGEPFILFGLGLGGQIIASSPPTLSYSGSPFTLTTGVPVILTPETTSIISSCTSSPPLPDGLTLNTTTCMISGTPTTGQTETTYIIAAYNAGGHVNATIKITINTGPPTISYTGSPFAFYRDTAITDISPSILTGSPTCSISPALPTGLSLNSSTCVISGTPTSDSSDTYTITATNGITPDATFDLTITVSLAPPTISFTGNPFTFTTDTAITDITPSLSGSPTCSVSPALPDGLDLDPSTCVISGTPTAVTASDTYTITANNGGGSDTFDITITVNPAPPTISYTGSPFTFTKDSLIPDITPDPLTGTPITSCTSSPTLPAGLSIHNTTCVISGTPTAVTATDTYTITAVNAGGSDSFAINITVSLAPPTIAYGPGPYTFVKNSAITAVEPTTLTGSPTCSMASGTPLPDGLSIHNTTCVISGTPTAVLPAGDYTIRATNDGGSTYVTTSINITVNPASPTISYSGSPFTFDLNVDVGTITPSTLTGTPLTSCSISATLPAGLSFNTSTCNITGTPTAVQTGVSYTVTATNATGSADTTIIITVDRDWYQDAYFKASNAGSGDSFGESVAIDGNFAIVGTPWEDSNATGVTDVNDSHSGTDDGSHDESGAAYIFQNMGSNWFQDAYLKPSNTGAADRFGNSVSISGNYAIVGAFHEDSDATGITNSNGNHNGTDDGSHNDSGAAYIFQKMGSSWFQDAYLKPSNTDPADEFGFNVAIDGNYAIVGARYEDSNATSINDTNGSGSADADSGDDDGSKDKSGAVYVFYNNGSNWIQDAYLKVPNSDSDDQFGYSVAIDGNYIIVGSPFEDSNQTTITNGDTTSSDDTNTNSGAVYIFHNNGTNWVQYAYLKASNNNSNDWFGYSVDIRGNYAIVGAVDEDSNSTVIDNTNASASDNNDVEDNGAVYIFYNNAGTWVQDAYLKPSNNIAGSFAMNFGQSVSINGNFAVVGAYSESSDATGIDNTDGSAAANTLITGSGAAYIFKKSPSGEWFQDAYLKASNSSNSIQFGHDVDISSTNDIIVGAYTERNNITGIDNNDNSPTSNSGTLVGAGSSYIFKHP